ncbi:class III signal peptide-containing protein, partial [Thermococcus sp.]
MGLVLKRRGQISLEFMLVFAIMLIMLLYSVRNVTFSSDSPS